MNNPSPLLLTRLGCSGGVLLVSVVIAVVLVKTRPEAKIQPPQEQVLAVQLIEAVPESLTVYVGTQGVVEPVRKVSITPQVGGRVVKMPLSLKAGDLVKDQQLLFTIDPADYQIQLKEAEAALARVKAAMAMIKINENADQAQLRVAARSRDLALSDFERAKKLSTEGQAVSVSVVESSERAYIQAEAQVLLLEQALAQVPSRLLEMESEMAAARARVEQAQLALQRTEIKAPFPARVLEANVEMDELLQPGVPVMSLADDRRLEIEVAVTAADLRNWIAFADAPETGAGWFAPLKPVPVSITWTESAEEISWEGHLNRIVRFDPTTRTATLAVRIEGAQLRARESGLPLTAGMFCHVRIPGKTLDQVIALPRSAVTFDNKAYLSKDGRLKTVDVQVARSQGDRVYVVGGVQPGDQVVVTRLVAPLEGVKLMEIQN